MRIVTVTLNPALDKTANLDELHPGGLNRLRDVVVDAGGKGINVSKMIAALGGESIASGFVGGSNGGEIPRTLDSLNISHDFVYIASATRTNLKVLDRGNRLTELNEPGPMVEPQELVGLHKKLQSYATPETIFIFSGSIPGGIQPDIYAQMIRMVKEKGAMAFLDADGKAFASALSSEPDFIKPNRYELLQHFGVASDADTGEVLRLCRELLANGVGRIALSMGEEGALFVSPEGAFLCPGLSVSAQSTVGAGDSMVGAVAYATASGQSWREAAALAMASSAGAVTTVGTKPPSRGLVDELLPRVVFSEI